MQRGLNEIDLAFAGIYKNLTGGRLGLLFNVKGIYSKLNPFGSTIKDKDLHKIASDLTNNSKQRERICANIYMGGRMAELLQASISMQEAKEALAKMKRKETLNSDEQRLVDVALAWQQNIVEVDSYTKEEYFKY